MTLEYIRNNYQSLRKEAIRRGETFSIFKFKKKLTANPSYFKDYLQKNKDKIYARNKKWRKVHPEVAKKYRKTHPWYGYCKNAKGRCIYPSTNKFEYYGGRGIKFLMTLKEIKTIWFRDKAMKMKRPSLDRIDSDGNYEASNCQFIELRENRLKRRYPKKHSLGLLKISQKKA